MKSDIVVRPSCTFCGQNIGKPQDPKQRKLGEFSVGKCQCGAVYASDPTGYNVGGAMVEALVYACNDDWDLAWDLVPEDDYLTGRLECYDQQTHQVVETGNLDGRKIKGVLYFIRLHKSIAEITDRFANRETVGVASASDKSIPEIEPARDPKRVKKKADKTVVREMTDKQDLDGLVDLVFDDLRTLRFMQRLLYTPDEGLRWRTVNALGKVCARLSTRKPGQVSDLLHRLFAACSDSASSSWGAIEAIGAIIGERPDIFGAFTRHLVKYLDDQVRQIFVLWALGTIAAKRPDLIRNTPFYNMVGFLGHPEPALRGHTLRLFGRIRAHEFRSRIESLCDDSAPVTIYEDGEAQQTFISALAVQAINLIDQNGAAPQ